LDTVAAEEQTSDIDLEKSEQDQSEHCASLGLKRSSSMMNLLEFGGNNYVTATNTRIARA